jgi:hypothetical protein
MSTEPRCSELAGVTPCVSRCQWPHLGTYEAEGQQKTPCLFCLPFGDYRFKCFIKYAFQKVKTTGSNILP